MNESAAIDKSSPLSRLVASLVMTALAGGLMLLLDAPLWAAFGFSAFVGEAQWLRLFLIDEIRGRL